MNNFFTQMRTKQEYDEWASILGWLFDDNRFSKEKGWEKGRVTKFTKQAKRQLGFSDNNFIKVPVKDEKLKSDMPKDSKTVVMVSSESLGRDFVRHIRNGIAHGHVDFFKHHSELWLEITDNNKQQQPTARIIMPVEYIVKLHKIYNEIANADANDRSKKRSRKNNKKAA